MTICKTCKAPIRWVKLSKTGKNIPLDPEPSPEGNVYISTSGRALVLDKDLVKRAKAADEPLHTSHFATCPQADAHRKARP